MKGVLTLSLAVAVTALILKSPVAAQTVDMYGNVTYQRAGDLITLRAQIIENYRPFLSSSGTLALQLWACSAPFTGGTIFGHKVAEANLGTLQGGYFFSNVNVQVPFYSPPTGSYFMVLVLAEWDWGQFKTLDWQNFQGTQSFFAAYSPILPTDGLLTSKFLGNWKGVQVVSGQQQVSIDAMVTRLGVNGFSLKATYNIPGAPQSDSTELYFDDGTIQGYANVNGQLTSVFNGRWSVNGNTITADYDIAEVNFSYSRSMVYTLQNDTTITMSGSDSTGDTISGSATKQGITPLPTPAPSPPPTKLPQSILPFQVFGNVPFGTTLTLSNTTSSAGLPVSFSVTSGPAVITDGNQLLVTGVGNVTIRATHSGNDGYLAASLSHSFGAVKANQTLSPFAVSTTVPFGSVVTFSNMRTSADLPVRFQRVSGPVAVSSNTVRITGVGPVVIRAQAAGNANYNAATPLTNRLTSVKADQSIPPFAPTNNVPFGTVLTMTNTKSSVGRMVRFAVVSGSAKINKNGTSITVTGVGSVMLRASQAGNTNYNAAIPLTNIFTTIKADQTIAFSPKASVNFKGNAPVALGARSSSRLPVSYTSSDSNVLTITRGAGVMKSRGTVQVTATQAGSANYNVASEVVRTIEIR